MDGGAVKPGNEAGGTERGMRCVGSCESPPRGLATLGGGEAELDWRGGGVGDG